MEDSVRQVMVDVIDRVADQLSQTLIKAIPEHSQIARKNSQGCEVDTTLDTGNDEADEWTCAICLEVPGLADRCSIVGCGHRYCVTCLVHWASRSSAARCPTCKNSFSLVSMNKHLDGSVAQAPVQETVAMAARSAWFRAWLAKRDIVPGQGHGTSAGQHGPRSAHSLMQEEWAEDALYSYFEQEYEEDDVEEYYVGRSNGRRNAFGNRPFGPNGYVRSGRKLAAVPRRPKGKASRDVVENNAGSGSQSSQKAPQQGRRAQRKAKRASAD